MKLKEAQIEYLKSQLSERIIFAQRTEELCEEKLRASEETKDMLTEQINDCKVKFKEYQNTINKNEKVIKNEKMKKLK